MLQLLRYWLFLCTKLRRMNGKNALVTLFLSAALATPVSADNIDIPPPISVPSMPGSAASASTQSMDPTLAFFTALSECTPGSYTEKNNISTEVGPAMLNQQIVGQSEDKLTCNATLSTPDGRTMTCAFPMYSVIQLNDQHFMQGMLADTADNPTADTVNADMLWSQLKADSCSF